MKRYSQYICDEHGIETVEDKDGDWVRYEDVLQTRQETWQKAIEIVKEANNFHDATVHGHPEWNSAMNNASMKMGAIVQALTSAKEKEKG